MTTQTTTEQFRDLAREAVFPNPNQPRKHFDEDALLELAGSLRENGLIQPVTVTPRGDGYMIVAGERRWRAAGLAGLETIPCRVMELTDEQVTILAITENVTRQDMDEIEEANAYLALTNLGKSISEIATMFGKSEEWIRYSLELTKLIEVCQWAVARKQISKNIGCYLALLSPAGQQATFGRIQRGEFKSNDEIIRHCTAVQKIENQQGLFDLGEPESLLDVMRETHRAAKRGELELAWEKIERLSGGLTPFMEIEPEAMAFALNNDIDVYVRQLEVLAKAVNRARNNARQAAAFKKALEAKGETNDSAGA